MEQNQNMIHPEENILSERIDHLIEHRIPWLFLGIVGGAIAAVIVSGYEAVLSSDIRLAFFIPIIVYLSDAVGSQTETIYIRAISLKKRLHLARYLFKESIVGLGIGAVSGLLLGMFAFFWLNSFAVGLIVALTMLINLTVAPALAIFIPTILYKRHADPALGSGPVATIIQDIFSIFIYFLIASFFL